jgi:uncharacterized membrane protein YczE
MAGRRELSPRAWARLILGLFGYGLAVSLMIESRLGLGPWDAFHYGMHLHTGLTVGLASIVAGLGVQVISWFIGVRPWIGTIANMILIGVFIDLLLPILPAATHWGLGLAFYGAGILICGLATGLYISAGLGHGPRDGLMIGVSQRTGWPVRRVRTLIELTVLLLGWLMGATIGVGTLLFALGIGPAVQWGLRVCGVIPRDTETRRHGDTETRRQEEMVTG